MDQNHPVKDEVPADIYDILRIELKQLGFANINEIVKTAQLVMKGNLDQTSEIILIDPVPDPNGINFKFIAIPGQADEGYRINQVIATKEVRPNVHAKETKTIKQVYTLFSGLFTKEQITHEMLLEMRYERNRLELNKNTPLRKQLTKMGFNYEKLVESSYEIASNTAELKGITVLHEELPLLGNRPNRPKHISIIFHVRKKVGEQHKLESISTSVYSDMMKVEAVSPQINYSAKQGQFPSKNEMIKKLGEIIPAQFSNISRAKQLFYLINEPEMKHRKSRLNPFRK